MIVTKKQPSEEDGANRGCGIEGSGVSFITVAYAQNRPENGVRDFPAKVVIYKKPT